MKHLEVELEAKVSEVRFGYKVSYKPRKGGSNDQQRMRLYHHTDVNMKTLMGNMKLMMIAKKKSLGKVSEAIDVEGEPAAIRRTQRKSPQ
ncbi:hypothetical protein BASA60_002406 [Batrachochytrium salamandrivorans]|nr:hypothetical protein BASA60_002406 [Batrachochytrium salamandrivorans]